MTELSTRPEDKIRTQRDRFLAFAFAGADVLLEIGPNGVISFAAGSAEPLLGLPHDFLVGRNLADMVIDRDRPLYDEALLRLKRTGRLERIALHFRLPLKRDSELPTAILAGIRVPNPDNRLHLTIARQCAEPAVQSAPCTPMDQESFVTMVGQRIAEGRRSGEEYSLTLLELPELPDEDLAHDYVAALEGMLRAWSVGGNSVGLLEGGKIGIVTDSKTAIDSLQKRVDDITRDFAPADGTAVRSATIQMEAGLSEEDIAKALVYTINKFVDQGDETLTVGSLAESCRMAMDETLSKVNSFRATINSDRFAFVFQPIVCLYSWDIHHFEALARIRQSDRLMLPSHFISFAEDIGVINELDMIVCRKAIATLRDGAQFPADGKLAVNLSGNSIGNSQFVADLIELLSANRSLLDRLLFEITESHAIKNLQQANDAVQKLRAFGCRVSLDDFGAGAAAFQYLRSLEVDYVKIDGSYILDAFDTRYGKPFIKAISTLCYDLGIRTIGEMVEDERAVKLLRDVSVDYGQGYYFSRPVANVASLVLPDKPASPSYRRPAIVRAQ